MINYIFLLILLILTIIDHLYFKIPNIIVLPAIALGIYLTRNWLSALIMFLVTAYIYKNEWWRGGDVKLMCLIGAFLGFKAIYVLLGTLFLISTHRWRTKSKEALAVTPFSLLASLPFIIHSVIIGTRG